MAPEGPFPTARDDAERDDKRRSLDGTPQTQSPSFRLAFTDTDFLLREDLRPVRLQLELLKPELMLKEQGIKSTVVVFGSARLSDPETAGMRLVEAEADLATNPADRTLRARVKRCRRQFENARYYDEARKLGRIVSERAPSPGEFVMLTGGGPGIMEAANRGASEVGAKSVALNIVLPHEQHPNPYVPPELSFRFHYFALRKMHFLQRAKALIIFPGGYGTLDEMFEAATLAQTGKIERFPFLLFGKDYWSRVLNFEALVEEGMIAPEDVDMFHYVETAEEAWAAIADFWHLPAAEG